MSFTNLINNKNMTYSIISQIFPIIALYILLMLIVYIYKFFNTTEKVKVFYKKRLIINGVSLGVLVIAYLVLNILFSSTGATYHTYAPSMDGGGSASQSVGGGFSMQSILPRYPDYNYGNTSISDTREFIKKGFNAELKTRDVEDVAKKVEVLVRGTGGRIDSSNIAERYASIGFVIPKSKLDDFEEQIRTYTNKKFYSQTVSSQNLLGEKKGIEQNQDTAKNIVAELTAQYEQAKAEYEKGVITIKSEINRIESQIRSYDAAILRSRNTLAVTTNDATRLEIEAEIIRLQESKQQETENLRIGRYSLSEITNSLKTLPMSPIGVSLDEANKTIVGLDKQEDKFFENVETVQGYVNVNYVTVWEIINLYSPINPIVLILAVAFIARMYFLRKNEKLISAE